MWVTYYENTGELYSYSRLQDLQDPTGLVEADVIEPASESGFHWDPVSRSFKVNPRKVSTRDFLGMFSTQERIVIRDLAKSDPIIEDFLWLLAEAEFIDGSDPTTKAGLDYLTFKTILTPQRVLEIKTQMGIE